MGLRALHRSGRAVVMMTGMIIHHKVKDYNAWRTVYDGHEKSRTSAGITNGKVFRRAEGNNDLKVLQDVADEGKARSWTASEELKSAMQKAGVLGVPTIQFIA